MMPPEHTSIAQRLARSRSRSPSSLSALRRHPARPLLYAVWFALATSLGEMTYWTYERLSGSFIPPIQNMWWIPLGYAIVFGAVGVIFALSARAWSDRAFSIGLVAALSFIASLGWLAVIHKLHVLAATALAAGLAAQLARLATQHGHTVHVLLKRTVAGLIIIVVGIGGGYFVQPLVHEWRTTARLPQPPPETPNILLIVLDTVRAKSLSLYGYERATTPNLERFAKRGVVFEHAISTAPWTLPSHGTMFTGQYPHELTGDFMAPIDASHPTVAEVLSRRGYLTAGFVANTKYTGAEFGLARGFAHYEDRATSLKYTLLATSVGALLSDQLELPARMGTDRKFSMKSAAEINEQFLGWLSTRDERRPYFAFLNYFDAHTPYVSPDAFARKFSTTRPMGDVLAKRLDRWSPSEVRELNDAYDGALSYLDHQLGALFDELERRGALEHTVVIVTADHGEQFGEHNLLEHANSLYMPLLHVPLVIVYPRGVPAGSRTSSFVSLRDLPATMFSFGGVNDPVGFQGRSLSRYWGTQMGTPAHEEGVLLAETQRAHSAYPNSYPARKGRMKSIVFKGMHYIKNYGDGREELYDLTIDPDERRDLAEAVPDRLAEYRTYLQQALTPTRP